MPCLYKGFRVTQLSLYVVDELGTIGARFFDGLVEGAWDVGL